MSSGVCMLGWLPGGATRDRSPSLGNPLDGRKEVLPFPFLLASHLPSSLVGSLRGPSGSGVPGLFFPLLCSEPQLCSEVRL